ncbi:GNAT family N-acetyltransferase [Wolbachia endosymbiont (group E) of Neria commutata]|uniref:GNAT family N-acetyltransferase n=1 Tax=Wolbachia endosymbiont (group E) of Neria commutata TaxID=3066149 RepID=UPI003132C64D
MSNHLINLFYKAEDFFSRSISSKGFEFNGKTKAYLTGVDSGDLNPLIVRENIPDINEVLDSCSEIFKKNKLPWVVVIPEHFLDDRLENILKDKNFKYTSKSVAMFIELNEELCLPQSHKNNNLIIKCVDENLTDWMIPLICAYESTYEVADQYRKTHENNAGFHHFSLYKDDKPVSSLTLSIDKDSVRVDDVGTLPEHQKKGYATHLMYHALTKARALNATHCFLDASESGVSVYQKIGFSPLFKRRIYAYMERK